MSLFRRILQYGGLIAVLFVATIGPVSASTNAYGSKFITSITYMNIGSGPANLSVRFVDNNRGRTVDYPILNNDGSARTLARNASASLSVSVLSSNVFNWTGGAIINANQPLVTTMVQVSTNPTIRVRPVSNGFTINDASNTISLPYVAKSCGSSQITTRINMQNVGPSRGDITATLYWPNGDLAYTQTKSGVTVGGVLSIDMGSVTVNSSSGYTKPNNCTFEGSAIITISGSSKIVATAFETSTTGRNAASYESLASPGTRYIQIPSVLCNVNYGDGAQSSSVIVHNSGASNATVRIGYRYQLRESNGSLGQTITVPPIEKGSLAPNRTLTINACSDLPARAVGAAVISSRESVLLTAISKVTGNGVYAVTPGIFRNAASAVAYAPYVRYSTRCFTAAPTNAVCRNESRQRTLFSVQNIGTGNTSIKVRMTLYNSRGAVVGIAQSSDVPPGGKVSLSPIDIGTIANTDTTNPNNEFGYWVIDDNIVYGGSAKFEALNVDGTVATIPIAVTVRVLNSTALGQTAEDYNAIPE